MRALLVLRSAFAWRRSLTLAAGAGATTFCDAAPPCVGEGGTAEPDLQSALTAARPVNGSPGADAVVVGPGTFAGPFSYGDSDMLTITGAGIGQTILTTSADNAITLSLSGNAGDAVGGLTVRAAGENATALSLGHGTADTVEAQSLGPRTRGRSNSTAHLLARHGELRSDRKYNSHVVRTEGASTISDCRSQRATGVLELGPAGRWCSGRRISASGFGVHCYTVHCAVRDTLIEMSGGSGQGVVGQCPDTTHSASASVRTRPSGRRLRRRHGSLQRPPAGALALVDSSILRGRLPRARRRAGRRESKSQLRRLRPDDRRHPRGRHDRRRQHLARRRAGVPRSRRRATSGRSDSPLLDAGNPAALGVDESATDLGRLAAGRQRPPRHRRLRVPASEPTGTPGADDAPPPTGLVPHCNLRRHAGSPGSPARSG